VSTGVVYRERLTPRLYAFAVVLALIAMIAVAYGAPFGARVGWLVFVGGAALAIWAMIAGSPVIVVTTDHLRVGHAVIDRQHLAGSLPLGAEDFRLARGRDADARRFTVLRSWHSGTGVIITLADSEDPHPGWLVTSAHPQELVAALA